MTGKRSRTVRRGVVGKVFCFIEQLADGSPYLSSVLNSERAIHVNIAIMRAFLRLRQMVATHSELAWKLEDLERSIKVHDTQIRRIFEAIRQLMAPPEKPKGKIGFQPSRG